MSYSRVFQSNSSQKRWVHQINKTVSKHIVIDVAPPPPSIFRVPQKTVDMKPEAYIPHRIGLGPYHHFHPEGQKATRQKLAAIKEILTPSQITNFQSLVVDKIHDLESSIRSCYDEYLDLDGDTLAWILAIDGLFLLYRVGYKRTMKGYKHRGDHAKNLLVDEKIMCPPHSPLVSEILSSADIADGMREITSVNEEKRELEINEDISWKDIAKIPKDVKIHPRETLMLENQIPIIVLKVLLNILNLSSSDSTLDAMLSEYGQKHSPLKMLPQVKFHGHDASPAHLLDYMYHLVVNNNKHEGCGKLEDFERKEHHTRFNCTGFNKFVDNMKQFISYLVIPDDSLRKPILLMKKFFILIPFDYAVGNSKLDGNTVEEIDIPSVQYLYEAAGVTFGVTDGGIRKICYDKKKFIFYLPVITLNANSEIILRNMIAYEQAISSPGDILELTEYVELMCGIIDTVKDVKMRGIGILVTYVSTPLVI